MPHRKAGEGGRKSLGTQRGKLPAQSADSTHTKFHLYKCIAFTFLPTIPPEYTKNTRTQRRAALARRYSPYQKPPYSNAFRKPAASSHALHRFRPKPRKNAAPKTAHPPQPAEYDSLLSDPFLCITMQDGLPAPCAATLPREAALFCDKTLAFFPRISI